MVSNISHTSVDAHDAYAQSVWWSQVVGYDQDPEDPNEPGHEECAIFAPDGSQQLLFIEVPDAKQVKNRIHFDLRPADRTRDAEVDRLLAHGASMVDDRRDPCGKGWAVLADPEGNEFCVLRGKADFANS